MSARELPMSAVRAIGFRTIVIREFGRIIRIWGQTLVPSAVTTTLYFVIFGSLVGRRIGEMGGVDYIAYIAPGLIMMAVITNSYGNVVSSFFGAKFGKHIEELLVSPLPNWVIIAGYVCGGLLRGMMVGLVVTTVALIFTWLHSHHLQLHNVLVVFGAAVLTSIVFSLGGMINAVFAKNFDHVNWIPNFVLTPLTYFGGVFYSIDLLPEWARQISMANPILHMVNAFRYGFLGTSDVSVPGAFVIMIACAVALYVWVQVLLNRGTGIRD
jgi:ABC-2 type transport system permease protein